MGILQEFLPLMFKVRGEILGTIVGARPYTIYVVNEIKSKTAQYSSRESISKTTTQIVESNNQSPKVKTVEQEDFDRGVPQSSELIVGPITPKFNTGGTEYSIINPVSGTTYYLIDGPGMESVKFVKVGFNGDRVLGYYLYLKRAS